VGTVYKAVIKLSSQTKGVIYSPLAQINKAGPGDVRNPLVFLVEAEESRPLPESLMSLAIAATKYENRVLGRFSEETMPCFF